MQNKVGIWIDKRTAKIVSFRDEVEEFHIIHSNIDEFHPSGGSGTKVKGGPQDVVHDRKYLEREKQQFKRFFKSISEYIKEADALVIFGPAQTGEKFCKALSQSNHKLYEKVMGIKPADSMTDNQIKVWVKDYLSV